MAELSSEIKANARAGLPMRGLDMGVAALLAIWLAATCWAMLSTFDLWRLVYTQLSFAKGGALGRIFTLPYPDALAHHALLLAGSGWLVLLMGAAGVGTAKLLRLPIGDEPPLMGLCLAAALGYAATYLASALLLHLNLLYDWLVWALTIIASLVTLLWLIRTQGLRDWRHRHHLASSIHNLQSALRHPLRHFFPLFMLLTIGLSLALAGATALAPPVLHDARLYHLPVPEMWAAHHGWVPIYSGIVYLFAKGMEYIYTWPMALLGPTNWDAGIIASMFHLALAAFTTIAAYGFSRALGLSRRAGLIAAATFVVVPLVNRVIGSAYVDIGTAFFTIICLYALYRWWQHETTVWLTVTALLAGFAIAVKVFSLTLLPLIALALLAKWWRTRLPSRREGLGVGALPSRRERLGVGSLIPYLRLFAVVVVITLLMACHSYLDSWAALGNPVWPIGNNLIGGRFSSPIADANYRAHFTANFYNEEGSPFSIPGLVTYMFWDPWVGDSSMLPGGVGAPRSVPIVTALLPITVLLLVLGWWQGRRRRVGAVGVINHAPTTPGVINHPPTVPGVINHAPTNPTQTSNLKPQTSNSPQTSALWWGFGYALLFIAFSYATETQRRYVFFTLPIIGAAAGWAYTRIRERLPLAGLALNAFLIFTLFVATLSNLAFNQRAFPDLYGYVDDNSYVLEAATLPIGEEGRAMLYIRNQTPAAHNVLVMDLISPLYYLNHDYLMSDPGWDNFLSYETLRTGDDFAARLDQFDIGYMLDNRAQPLLAPLLKQGMWRGRNLVMHMTYAQGGWYAYWRDASPPPTGLHLEGKAAVIGFDGGLPSDLPTAVSLDGLERLKAGQVTGVQYVVVKRNLPLAARMPYDKNQVYALDAATVDVGLAKVAKLAQETADYHVYDVRGVDLAAALGLREVAIPRAMQITVDQSGEAQLVANGGFTLTLPLTVTNPLSSTDIPTDHLGPPRRGLSAAVGGAVAVSDTQGATALLIDVQASLGAIASVQADTNMGRVTLIPRFNGSGDGVADQMVLPLPPTVTQISRLYFTLSGTQGGTANIVGQTLSHAGGQGTVRLVVKGLMLLQ